MHLLRDLMNFDDILGKIVTDDDIKSDEKQSLTLLVCFLKCVLRVKALIFFRMKLQCKFLLN